MTEPSSAVAHNPFHSLLAEVKEIEAFISHVFNLASAMQDDCPLRNLGVTNQMGGRFVQSLRRAQALLDRPGVVELLHRTGQVQLHTGPDAPADRSHLELFLGGACFVLSAFLDEMWRNDFLRAARHRLACADLLQAFHNVARLAEGDCREGASQWPSGGAGVRGHDGPAANADVVTDDKKPGAGDQYVTLNQAAAIVGKTKRTLERYLKRCAGDAPLPDVEHDSGSGKANEWRWSKIRPWLEQVFKRVLDERFPSWHFQN